MQVGGGAGGGFAGRGVGVGVEAWGGMGCWRVAAVGVYGGETSAQQTVVSGVLLINSMCRCRTADHCPHPHRDTNRQGRRRGGGGCQGGGPGSAGRLVLLPAAR